MVLAGKMGRVNLLWLLLPFEDLLWSYFLDPVSLPSLSHHHVLWTGAGDSQGLQVNGGPETWSGKSFLQGPRVQSVDLPLALEVGWGGELQVAWLEGRILWKERLRMSSCVPCSPTALMHPLLPVCLNRNLAQCCPLTAGVSLGPAASVRAHRWLPRPGAAPANPCRLQPIGSWEARREGHT